MPAALNGFKECSKCHQIKKVSEFSKDKKYKDGLQCKCKECDAEWRKNNKEKITERKAEYYENNKEKFAKRGAEWRKNNKEKIIEYYKNNKEKIIEYRKNNKEKIAKRKAEYYKNNKEKIAEYYKNNAEKLKQYSIKNAEKQKKWRKENPEKTKLWREKNKNKRRWVLDKIHYNLTPKQSDIVENLRINGKCFICGRSAEKGGISTHNGNQKKLCLDHNHDTGQIRGMLCGDCNHFEGYLKKQLELEIFNINEVPKIWKDYLENPPGIPELELT
jgi:hypothetical protein